MMLPSKYKIRGNDNIEEVKKKGRIFQSQNFGVAILRNDEEIDPKFAFVISSKISKLAVHRNRINRAMQEGVRRIIKEIPKPFNYLFLAKKNLASKTTDEIINEVVNFFETLKI